MKIELSELGRHKLNITIPYSGDVQNADAIAEVAQRGASKHVASRFVDAIYDLHNNEGNIEAGYRIIGKFRLVE